VYAVVAGVKMNAVSVVKNVQVNYQVSNKVIVIVLEMY
jgi:hypothetical protein